MKMTEVTSGEFAGWHTWPGEPFEHDLIGPFYTKFGQDGDVVCAFRAENRHMNGGGVIHGGCLMSFADYALFAIAHEHMGDDEYGLTVAFTSEFLSGPKEGDLIEARGEVLRAGGSIVFVRGIVYGNGVPCLNFSGTIKRVRPRTS